MTAVVVENMSHRPEDDPIATDDVIHHEHEPHPSSTNADLSSDVDEVINDEEVVEKDTRTFFFRHVTIFVKGWGLLTLAGMWTCTVLLLKSPTSETKTDYVEFERWYWLGVSIAVSIIELLWYINKCAVCRDNGGCCCTCWRLLMLIDNWNKGLLYVGASVPGFIHLHFISCIAGLILLLLGLMYVLKTCAECRCVGGKKFVRRSYGSTRDTTPTVKDPEPRSHHGHHQYQSPS